MDVTIKINCDNAAFEHSANAEVARILKEVAKKVADRYVYVHPDEELKIYDHNGNRVGDFTVTA